MSELEEKIIWAKYSTNRGDILKDGHSMWREDIVKDLNRKSYLEEKLSLIQIEVDCKECFDNKGIDSPPTGLINRTDTTYICIKCKGTGKITKTPESGDEGRIL